MEGAQSAPQIRLKIKRFVPPPVYDREDPEDPSATKLLWSNEAHVAPSIFNLISNEGEFGEDYVLGSVADWVPPDGTVVHVRAVPEHRLPVWQRIILIGPLDNSLPFASLPCKCFPLVGANDEPAAAAAAAEVNWGVIPDFVEFMLQSADEHDMLEAIRQEIRSSPLGVDPFRSYDENRHFIRAFIEDATKRRSRNLGRLEAANSIIVTGPRGTGKSALVRGLALEGDLPVVWITPARLASEFSSRMAAGLSRYCDVALRLQPSILVIDDMDALFPAEEIGREGEEDIVHALLSFLERLSRDAHHRVLVVGITNHLEGVDKGARDRFEDVVTIEVPTAEQRVDIFHQCLRKFGVPLGGDIMAACRDAALFAHERRAGGADPDNVVNVNIKVTRADLLRALKPIKASGVREVTVSLPQIGWRDIGGLHDVKAKLRQTVTWAYEHREAYGRLGIQPPRGILLYGPPGTGKTLLCAAVAGECHANFITLSIADLLRSEVGESEKRLAEVFRKARQSSPCVIFFDEIQALLLEMDMLEGEGCGVVVMAATNTPQVLDASLLRPGRFDRCIYVGPPDQPQRQEILHLQTQKMPLASDVSLDFLAMVTENYTGADLMDLCRNAAVETIKHGRDVVNAQDFMAALQMTLPSVSKEEAKRLREWRIHA
ncbi:ATPase, AAA domain containing protein [Acanthamoeba castellanii str. Neff]|uniref:ATPase, AAA domain containing protein n=1 Tax=Acanthamoeba castellanii (strain ATCC 30010 / Neff) TaxID=1257118 RepID=L8GHG0_ACACF|nr:ATPase, AAA domain containing protein [Acanthamoeba castellanii str. Neff]ELR11601.1 ATPase, AAA domain containing protein [Acanthamoeba castellanii str. Neff]